MMKKIILSLTVKEAIKVASCVEEKRIRYGRYKETIERSKEYKALEDYITNKITDALLPSTKNQNPVKFAPAKVNKK